VNLTYVAAVFRLTHEFPPLTVTSDSLLNLKPGVYEIWSRAIDAFGRTQPLDGSIFWNPNGYEWTGVFKIEVTAQ